MLWVLQRAAAHPRFCRCAEERPLLPEKEGKKLTVKVLGEKALVPSRTAMADGATGSAPSGW